MIDLYTWSTPNGRKVSIMLEEVGLPYEVHPINIGQDDQFKPEFLAISPNNKIPAIVDRDNGYKMFESGAILIYLAEKTGQLLPPADDYLKRMDAIQWLMFQMGGVGPFFGQTHHFNRFAKEKIPYADRALRHRDQAALRRDGPAPRRGRLSGRRRLLDRRRRDLALGVALGVARARPRPARLSRTSVRWYDAIRGAARRCSAATTCRRRISEIPAP